MNKDAISIEKVQKKNVKTPMHILENNWKVLAFVNVRYYEIVIHCLLVEGYCDKKKSNFYFLELPCFRFRNRERWSKFNLLNFDNKENSDKFQNIAFGLIIDQHPDLFPEVFKEMRLSKMNKINNKVQN